MQKIFSTETLPFYSILTLVRFVVTVAIVRKKHVSAASSNFLIFNVSDADLLRTFREVLLERCCLHRAARATNNRPIVTSLSDDDFERLAKIAGVPMKEVKVRSERKVSHISSFLNFATKLFDLRHLFNV